jgi:hypothetical protein
MKPKLNPRVFEMAAERIADGRNSFCCTALNGVFAERLYEKFLACNFKPEHIDHRLAWWDWPCQEEQEARILALLLSAEMCRPNKKRKSKS